jgi:hypothetical protein
VRYKLSYADDSITLVATSSLNLMAVLLMNWEKPQDEKILRLICLHEGDWLAARADRRILMHVAMIETA